MLWKFFRISLVVMLPALLQPITCWGQVSGSFPTDIIGSGAQPAFLDAERKARENMLNSLKPVDISQRLLDLLRRLPDQTTRLIFLEGVSASEQRTEYASDPDNLKSQLAEKASQANEFKRQRQKVSLVMPFECEVSEEQDAFERDNLQVAIGNGGDVKPDLQYQHSARINGTISLMNKPEDSGDSGDSGDDSAEESSNTHEPPAYSPTDQRGAPPPYSLPSDSPVALQPEGLGFPVPSAPSYEAEDPLYTTDELINIYPEVWWGLREVARNMGLKETYAKALMAITQYHVTLIWDDSGSMAIRDTGVSHDVRGGMQLSREEELVFRNKAMAELLSIVAIRGMTIRYLNLNKSVEIFGNSDREHRRQSIYWALNEYRANGGTPLNRVFWESFLEAERAARRTIVYLFTDGEPTDICCVPECEHRRLIDCCTQCEKVTGILHTIEVIRKRQTPDFFPIGLIKCTGDDCDWMEQADVQAAGVGTQDDFFSEKRQVIDQHGADVEDGFTYDYPEHIAAGLLSPINATFDNLDERRDFTRSEVALLKGKTSISEEEYARYKRNARLARNSAWWRRWLGRQAPPVTMKEFRYTGLGTLNRYDPDAFSYEKNK